jgi:isocitrate dehydrogenase
MSSVITWTKTDESPELASASFLPIARNFGQAAGIQFQTLDISFAGRILQAFPEFLTAAQQAPSALKELAELVREKDCRLLKLPNASATENQLKDAIKELQDKGFALPDYPAKPKDAAQQDIKKRYDALTGSVVNPVMRQGNAVRSIPKAVKEAARAHPHALGEWKATSKTRVAHMDKDDFYSTEESKTVQDDAQGPFTLEFVNDTGTSEVLKTIEAKGGDIFDTALMRRNALQNFLEQSMQDAADEGILLSMHLKATMMKKSDGLFFGDAVKTYFKTVFDNHGATLDKLGVKPQNGLNDILTKIETLDKGEADAIRADIESTLQNGPALAYANPKEAQTHLSSPNLVIIDVSMANLARWGGEVADKDGNFGDTLAVIPDSTYARMHQTGIDFLKANGTPDVKTLGSVTTIRLQAEGAEEYGSKDTTFEAEEDGEFILSDKSGAALFSRKVKKGDIFRLCKTTDRGIQNWIDIAIETAEGTTDDVIFWLDKNRAHDAQMIAKVEERLKGKSLSNVKIMAPEIAMVETLKRAYAGQNTYSVAGNLLGDHVTDYFPILEIGSSSKMLSIIQLLNGGVVAETGSGGTAPDLLSMIEADNHFLWDDTGTALALAECMRHIGKREGNSKALVMADTLESAAQRYIKDERSPSPKGFDARESHFYMALYWAQELRSQNQDAGLKSQFETVAKDLEDAKEEILAELKSALSQKGEMGGRYKFPDDKLTSLMRPSQKLNSIIPK